MGKINSLRLSSLPANKGNAKISTIGEIVASVSEAKEEVEEVKPIDMSAIEVEKKGKVEVEGEAGADAPATDKKETKKA
jgi:hypothetical protein